MVDAKEQIEPNNGNEQKPVVRVTRIDDLDQPIYRIFPLWFFEEALRTRTLALMSPSKWPDPYEDVCSNVFMRDGRNRGGDQKALSCFLMPAYAQCWSFEANSDILLRAYSRVNIHPILRRNTEPANEGVRVETTPRKLIQAVNAHAKTQQGVLFYLGRVIYADGAAVTAHIYNKLTALGANVIGRGDHRADVLFLKRSYFRHEEEVRLLAIFENPQAKYDTYRVQIDPNHLFEKVGFDPRLIAFERIEREASARALGYNGEFTREEHTNRILWDVEMPNGWDE